MEDTPNSWKGCSGGCATSVALLLMASGGLVILAPITWYETGPCNHNLVDGALADLVSACGLRVAVPRVDHRFAWSASAWPPVHAGFHVSLWLTMGLPSGPAPPAEMLSAPAIVLIPALDAWGLPHRHVSAGGKPT